MSQICIKILNKDWKTQAVSHGEDEVNLVYPTEYHEGDRIIVEIEEGNQFYWLQLDDGRGKCLVYLTGNVAYEVPFGERRINLSPKSFWGTRHLLTVKKAKNFEIEGYRNLAINIWDQHGEVNCYPHASANVETRGESVFAAMNAIDGIAVTDCHGEWPYESWGINQRDDACFKLEFGRTVEVDRVVIYTRADYPHDNWWKQAMIDFSDGSTLELNLKKTGTCQEFLFETRQIEWLELKHLIKAEGVSPFPALIQIEVYGRECLSL